MNVSSVAVTKHSCWHPGKADAFLTGAALYFPWRKGRPFMMAAIPLHLKQSWRNQ